MRPETYNDPEQAPRSSGPAPGTPPADPPAERPAGEITEKSAAWIDKVRAWAAGAHPASPATGWLHVDAGAYPEPGPLNGELFVRVRVKTAQAEPRRALIVEGTPDDLAATVQELMLLLERDGIDLEKVTTKIYGPDPEQDGQAQTNQSDQEGEQS